MKTSLRVRIGVALLVALAAVSPITVDSSGNVGIAEACADTACCYEDRSICTGYGLVILDRYRSATPCKGYAY